MSEEQAQQLIQQMQMLETYFADLSQKESSLLAARNEAALAITSIKSLKENNESDTLMPVGMGAYVRAKFSSDSKIVLNIGAGAAVERDADSVMNYLETRIREVEVAVQDISARKQDVGQRMEQLKAQVNQLMQAAQNQGSGNV